MDPIWRNINWIPTKTPDAAVWTDEDGNMSKSNLSEEVYKDLQIIKLPVLLDDGPDEIHYRQVQGTVGDILKVIHQFYLEEDYCACDLSFEGIDKNGMVLLGTVGDLVEEFLEWANKRMS